MSDSAEQAAWEQEALAAFHVVQYGPDGLSGGHIDSWVRGAHWGWEEAIREVVRLLEDALPILDRDKSERSLELQTSIERTLAEVPGA